VGADAWGIDGTWLDTADVEHQVPAPTIDAIRAALGPPGEGRDVLVVRPGTATDLDRRCEVVLEDGTDAGEHDRLPADLPLGIHELHPIDGTTASWCIVSPGRCHLPADLWTWGVTMQVPTTRSRGSWGMGDLADVRALSQWVADRGGGALGLSPLHAPAPVAPILASPYSPSSRRWHSPLLLRVDELPGAADDPEVRSLAARARGLLDLPLVDRDRAWALQRTALEHLWGRRGPSVDAELAQWRAEHGRALEGWARYCALADQHGSRWSQWPSELRHPDGSAVDRAARARHDRVAFHAWLQLLVAQQLEHARVPGVRLIQDLAVGCDPDGADAWLHQDLLALDMSIGAPPDDFEPYGQRWGLPPWIPGRLRDAGYRPLAALLRAAMAAEGGVRIDHVMGLSRLFWVPPDGAPGEGAYVRFPGRELLEVLALESTRARAVVVGEDLGTVEPSFRDELARTAVLSTRVVWFEDVPPERYPRASLAMVTTHDLPTTVGAWTGADDLELAELGRSSPVESNAELQRRLDDLVELDRAAPAEDALVRVHEHLGAAASVLVLATMEDLAAVAHRPNVPGTTTERTNWSTPLPLALDDLPEDPLAGRISGALVAGRAQRSRGD
jgi:4-alpha-glucanotransferase